MASPLYENRSALRTAGDSLKQINLTSIPKDLRDEIRDLRTRTNTIDKRLTEVLVARGEEDEKP